jgi:hypothetical protein
LYTHIIQEKEISSSTLYSLILGSLNSLSLKSLLPHKTLLILNSLYGIRARLLSWLCYLLKIPSSSCPPLLLRKSVTLIQANKKVYPRVEWII